MANELAVRESENEGRALFDPDRLEEALRCDLSGALCALAGALDEGTITGELRGFMPGAGPDDRVYLTVTLRLAAPVWQVVKANKSEGGN